MLHHGRVLVAEDEIEIASFLRVALLGEGYDVEVVGDGARALASFARQPADLVILDRMMPGVDGVQVARELRRTSNVPIILLTARESLGDRVEGLDAGADDYIIKPFALAELLARVRAHLRRVGVLPSAQVRVGDLVMNLEGREVFRSGRRIELSAKEFELLELLARAPGQPHARDVIEARVWPEYGGESNVVDVYIGYLRRKLEEDGERRILHTVRGVGYVLRESV